MTSAMAADLRPGDPPTSASSPTLSTRVEKNYASDAEGRPFSAAEFAGGEGGAGTYTLPTGSLAAAARRQRRRRRLRSLGGDGGDGGGGSVSARPGRRGLSEECRASLAAASTEEAASVEATPSAPAPPSLPPPSAPPASAALGLEDEDEVEEEVVQNSVISSEVNALTLTLTLGLSRVLTQALTSDQVNTHGAESELDAVTPVLRIEMRDACGEEIAISGLEQLIEIAIPLQATPVLPYP